MGTLILVKETFTWRVLIDILLMAAGLFFLYRTLLRLGTWKIVAGVLVAMFVFFVANVLDLRSIEWVYSNLSHVALIALIVIFQPELRKFFERAVSVRRAHVGDAGEELSLILVDAIWKLAIQRQGAIVVFPGKEPIQEWLSGGYPLEAKPSFPLVMSIFDPNSPGHDGALIVENGRFSRFSVRLPVSQSGRLSEDYGTRHHAAMGLVEKSDALAIVVSEERGRVSLFLDGHMRKVKDRDEIAQAIGLHWKNTATYSIEMLKGIKRWPIFVQMIASLGLATLFWSTLIVAQGEILEKVVTAPVEYTTPPTNLILVGDKEKTVSLHLGGARADFDALNSFQLNVKMDLSKAVPGKQSFLITTGNIRLPKNIKLLDVVPSSLEVNLAEIVEQEIMVEPQLIGKLPGGLKIRSVEVKPEKVKVLSPAVDKKSAPVNIITTPIYLGSIKNDSVIYCKIIAPPAVQPIDKRWPDVEVSIEIGQE